MGWTELRERSHSGGSHEHEIKRLMHNIKQDFMALCEIMEESDYGERHYGERGDAWRIERERGHDDYGERRMMRR